MVVMVWVAIQSYSLGNGLCSCEYLHSESVKGKAKKVLEALLSYFVKLGLLEAFLSKLFAQVRAVIVVPSAVKTFRI